MKIDKECSSLVKLQQVAFFNNDKTNHGFDPAATPSNKMKVGIGTANGAYSFMGINAQVK